MRNKQNMVICFGIAFVFLIMAAGTTTADPTETHSFSVISTFGDDDVFYFTVDRIGTISAEATWTGSASNLALILNGPGQVGYYSREDGTSPLSLSYTVTSDDLSKGTEWRISIVNFEGGSADGTVRITYPETEKNLNVLVSPESESVKIHEQCNVVVTVTGTDDDKPISGAHVELNADPGNVDPASGTTGDDGKFVSTFTSSEEGPAFIEAIVTGENLYDASGSTSVEVILLPLNVLVSPESEFVKINELCKVTVTVTGTDGKGISGAYVELNTDLGNVDPESGETNSFGKFVSTFTSSEEGPAFIEAIVTAENFYDASDSTSVEVILIPPPNVLVSSESESVELNTESKVTITVTGTDGRRISDAFVELETDLGNVDPASGTTDLSGKFVSTFTSSEEGTAEITANVITEGVVVASGETYIKVNQPSPPERPPWLAILVAIVGIVVLIKIMRKGPKPMPSSLNIQIEPGSIPADGKSTATVTIKLKDEKGNFISSSDERIVELSTTLGTITSPIKILPGKMEVTATITSGQTAGTAGIVATLSPAKGEKKSLRVSGKLTFTAPMSNEAGLDMKIEPDSIPADGISTAKGTIRIKDEKGNFISSSNGRTIELSTTLGTITSPVKIQPGAQEGVATITSGQISGTAKVTASSSPLKEATALVDFVPTEAGLDIQIEPDSIPADGRSTAKITVKIKDGKGNFIPSRDEKIVELSTTLGEVTSRVKIPSGAEEGTATITSGHVVGTAKVTASSSPLSGEGKSLHGEGKIVLVGPAPDESGPDVKNTP